ncbi:hypothetical protein FOZ60_017515 [Perkinsus olseni]|uniref:Uncharacterized protein n=1 Tax=Perkinsus olseni TaxID=32597 RepID=A0A7J6PHM8_PEROL|nr:hypothetical protein FOZ60_017515 [Perkinsus olseni]
MVAESPDERTAFMTDFDDDASADGPSSGNRRPIGDEGRGSRAKLLGSSSTVASSVEVERENASKHGSGSSSSSSLWSRLRRRCARVFTARQHQHAVGAEG